MSDGMDGFDRWLRQRLAATVADAGRAPRRRLPLPGATATPSHPRRDGFVAGVLTTAVLFGLLWAATTVRLHRSTAPAMPQSAAGRVLSSVTVPDPVFTVAAGEGGVWVPDDREGTLLRIDPRTGQLAATISISPKRPVLAGLFDAVATSPGAVWVTSVVDNSLLRIDPSSNRVAQRISLGMRPSSLSILGGDAWITGSQANRVLRVAVQTGTVEARIVVTDPGPVAAGDGTVWVVSEMEGVLSRIDPATNRVDQVLQAAAGLDYVVDAVVATTGGAWFRDLAAQSVEHVDGLTRLVTEHADVGGPATWGVTDPFTVTTTDGALWLSVNDALVRVDVRTLRVSRLPLVDPAGVAAAADQTLWVTTAQSRVVHVAPGSG
jgi:streptogramin lyase